MSGPDARARELLALPMPFNPHADETIGGYLSFLLMEAWSGRDPFAEAGWRQVVYQALALAGEIETGGATWTYDEFYLPPESREQADELVRRMIFYMGEDG